jgi:hypothetical protein
MLACGPAVDIRVVAHKLWQSSGHVLEHGDDLLDAAMRADGLLEVMLGALYKTCTMRRA